MPGQMPQAYEGDLPYIFVDYAHADRDAVLPIIRALAEAGYRVWYDDGIEPTTDYDVYLADHVYGCDCLVMFVSRSSLASDWCTLEVRYALNLNKKILPIYLEDVELIRVLQMRMGHKQALLWYVLDSDEFYRKLFKTRKLESCLTEKGKLARGVKPRNDGAETGRAVASQPVPVEAEPKTEVRVEPKAEPTSAPDAMPTTKAVQGASADQRGTVRPPRAVEQGGGGASLSEREERRTRVVVADKLDRSVGVVKRDRLSDYSWGELKELSRAIAAAGSDAEGLGIAKVYHLIDNDGRLRGDEKPFLFKDGTKTSARILGFRHDGLAGGGKAGISFEFADVPTSHRMNPDWDNEGGWEKSDMRGWLNDGRAGFLLRRAGFLSLLPDDLRPLVEAAEKRTNNRGEVAENDTACVTATSDTLWLLSVSEVYGKLAAQEWNVPWSPATYDAEGVQYQLYADKGVSTSSYGFCAKNGADSWWWLRSPRAYDANGFHGVGHDGDWYWLYNADGEWGVSPGFCF